MQNENLEDMSGGLSDMNKDLSGMYNHSKSTESSVLPPMKENIIEDLTGRFKVSNKHSDSENHGTVLKEVMSGRVYRRLKT